MMQACATSPSCCPSTCLASLATMVRSPSWSSTLLCQSLPKTGRKSGRSWQRRESRGEDRESREEGGSREVVYWGEEEEALAMVSHTHWTVLGHTGGELDFDWQRRLSTESLREGFDDVDNFFLKFILL